MPGRVEEHPPGLARLRVGHRRAELDGPLLGGVEVLDREVEVELLAAALVREVGATYPSTRPKPSAWSGPVSIA